jgi:hypothetical protein
MTALYVAFVLDAGCYQTPGVSTVFLLWKDSFQIHLRRRAVACLRHEKKLPTPNTAKLSVRWDMVAFQLSLCAFCANSIHCLRCDSHHRSARLGSYAPTSTSSKCQGDGLATAGDDSLNPAAQTLYTDRLCPRAPDSLLKSLSTMSSPFHHSWAWMVLLNGLLMVVYHALAHKPPGN